MNYPDVEDTIGLLRQAADEAATRANAEHPEDIAIAMSVAIESAGPVIMACWRLWGS